MTTNQALHAARCRREGCDWNTTAFSLIGLYGKLEDHFKDDHGVTDAEWREIRDRLRKPNHDPQTSLEGFA